MSEAVSKSEFAKLIGVSAPRVTQMIAEGKISGEAIEGEGRKAKIVVDLACQQIGHRRDIGQSLGNGAGTNLAPDTSQPEQAAQAEASASREPTEDEIFNRKMRNYKLREAERKDRQAQEADLLTVGKLMKTEDAVAEIEGVTARIDDILDGFPDRLGPLLAAEFEIKKSRELVFFLRQQVRDLKKQIADDLDASAENLEPLVEYGVGDAESGKSEIVAAGGSEQDPTQKANSIQ